MSKRPTNQTKVRSRLRNPVGWLRDLPIWSKLALIMIVPTVATIVVGLSGLADRVNTSNIADRSRTLAALTGSAGSLVDELQNERADAAMLLGSPNDKLKSTFVTQEASTDAAAKDYRQRRAGLANLPPGFRTLLNRIDNEISDLPAIRQNIVDLDNVSMTATMFEYRSLIDDLLATRDFAAQLAGDSTISYEMRAAAAIASNKEYLSLERVIVLEVLGRGEMTPELRDSFISTLTGQQQALNTFNVVATPEEKALLDQSVSGSDLYEAVKYQGVIEALPSATLPAGIFTPQQWDNAMVGRADLVRSVEKRIDDTTVQDATAIRDRMATQVVVEASLLFGLLLLGLMFAMLLSRQMNRSLRQLRHGALSVAQFGLPQAVARLRDPALTAQLTPVQVAAQIAEPIRMRSHDEFSQVAEAFNAVHLEAVRTAAEQAALRSSVAQMFVNLARRSQILVDRLIGHLDRLERGEEDPDALAELFQLDHLATRMRRNDENLLVLAGADSTRVQRDPAPLIDVLRAAQSEVEHYTRIEFGTIDRDIDIAPQSVNDLVHLVAELFDNATAFSPPDSVVLVEARRVGDRAVLYVEDRGIGISPEQTAELNERLADPPMVDVAVSRMMGLVVVARLAKRHGVKVELRNAAERGTVADVTLPPSVLVPRTVSGRGGPGLITAGGSSGRRAPAQPGPLALESGPGANRGSWDGPAPVSPAAVSGSPAGPGAPSGPARNAPLFGHRIAAREASSGAGTGTGHGRDADLPPRYPFDRMSGVQDDGPAVPAGAQSGRGLPVWSDLTGADPDAINGNGSGRDPRGPSLGESLAQMPYEPPRGSGGPPPAIPRQMPSYNAEQPPSGAAAPVSGPGAPTGAGEFRTGVPGTERGAGVPGPAGTGPQPPAWPPVAPAVQQPMSAPASRAPTPPPTSSRPAPSAPRPPAVQPPLPSADETVEMPIFRELESAWFHTPRAAQPPSGGRGATGSARSHPSRGTASVAPSQGGVGVSVEEPVPADDGDAAAEMSWRTAADPGWRAASAATQPADGGHTGVGLPKRVPMAQLVPGAVDFPDEGAKTTQVVNRRTPDAVRGLLSAYHRGVQRGRTQTAPDAPSESNSTGPNGSQSGKEQEA